MRKKGLLLFEVAVVVLLVSLASLFLFRGYGVFLKAGKSALRYIQMIGLTEEKLFSLQAQGEQTGVSLDDSGEGKFSGKPYGWQVSFVPAQQGLLWVHVTLASENKPHSVLDTQVLCKEREEE